MKRVFSAWAATEADPPHSLIQGDQQPRNVDGTAMEDCAVCVFRIEASSWEEAMAIYHVRQGWEPYRPEGPAEACPRCAALFYPNGSGQCWRCDYEC